MLLVDGEHPAGPGRLVPVSGSELAAHPDPQKTGLRRGPAPTIRPGDRVVVEEHTTTSEAYLEAVALGAAALGSSFNVRLKIGGKVVRTVALAPGRALLAPPAEARP
jgi:hypothetical protein